MIICYHISHIYVTCTQRYMDFEGAVLMENSNFKVRCKPACFGTKKMIFWYCKKCCKKVWQHYENFPKFFRIVLWCSKKSFLRYKLLQCVLEVEIAFLSGTADVIIFLQLHTYTSTISVDAIGGKLWHQQCHLKKLSQPLGHM